MEFEIVEERRRVQQALQHGIAETTDIEREKQQSRRTKNKEQIR
jgi:hypothetical protein